MGLLQAGRHFQRQRLARGAFLCAALLPGLCASPAVGSELEYRVKAAFLFNFAKFVTWHRGPSPAGELAICVTGSDPFGPLLDETVAGKSVGGRRLSVHRPESADDLRRCAILFVGASDAESYSSLLGSLGDAPVLTVGDDLLFLEAGGVIAFSIEDGKVRFRINPEAPSPDQLTISSKLLSLSR